MKKFNYYSPTTLQEAVAILSNKDNIKIIAGGTDLVIALTEQWDKPDNVLNITKLPNLHYIKVDDKVRIGALTTFRELEESSYLQENVPILYRVAFSMGGPQTRALATIGGNIANGSVAADSVPALTALDATVVLMSSEGKREVKIAALYHQEFALRRNEILVEVYFDLPQENRAASFVKLGKRNALAIVVISSSVYIEKTADNTIKDIRIILGAVANHPLRCYEAEKLLLNQTLTAENLCKCLDTVSNEVYESIKTRASVSYKKESVKGIVRVAFDDILADFAKGGK